jgi:colicin import membrane protein
MTMPEQKESSVLFSLKELMNLEEDRIKQEEQEKRRQEDAANNARMDAERRTREEEEARANAEESRRRADEQRVREDAARVEAIRQAEIERARLEAENAARIEQLKHQQEHERHITALTQDKHKKKLTFFAYGAAAFLVIALVGGGLIIKRQMDASAAEKAQHDAEMAEQKALTDKLNLQLAQQEDSVKKLSDAVQNAKDDKARRDAMDALALAQKQAAETRANLQRRPTGNTSTTTTTTKPSKPCACQVGDPLCSCIP